MVPVVSEEFEVVYIFFFATVSTIKCQLVKGQLLQKTGGGSSLLPLAM